MIKKPIEPFVLRFNEKYMGNQYRAANKKLVDEETGTIRKDFGGRTKVALVYPNTYKVGMSNLGFQILYRLLNKKDNVVCERAFLPRKALLH